MADSSQASGAGERRWWQAFGPALITACVVLGPGSLLVSANLGARHGYQLLWLLVLTGLFMGTYVVMAARIGVVGGATPCTLVAARAGRPAAVLIGVNLCLVCGVFQFGNNLAVAMAVQSLFPMIDAWWVLVGLNGAVIVFLFTAKQIYSVIENVMKAMVAIMLVCFVANLLKAHPHWAGVVQGLIPTWPEEIPLGLPQKIKGVVQDPMVLVASLIGTNFSVSAAFYQGNLVRDKGWTLGDYRRGIGDAVAGVALLTLICAVILITSATVIPGEAAGDVATLAQSLRPLLGSVAHGFFCIGLMAVTMTSFLVNAMIGGGILADGIGRPAQLSDRWPRLFTVALLLVGMAVAMLVMQGQAKPVNLIIFGQALTVLCNPLMAATLLWLANRKDVLGERRNRAAANVLGGLGLLLVILLAARVLTLLILRW